MSLGKVVDIFSAKKGQSGLPRPKVDSLNLIYGFGIENDKFAGKDESRAVMIVGLYSYDLAKISGVVLEHGSLGENILLDFNPHDFHIGTQFQIGDVILEITENCTICNHLAVFDDELPILLKECRGLYAKIVAGGKIIKNMPVKLIENIKIA